MKKEIVDREYSTVRVPDSEKKSFWELLVVWIGYVFVVTGMQVGGTMGGSMDLKHFSSLLLLEVLFFLFSVHSWDL